MGSAVISLTPPYSPAPSAWVWCVHNRGIWFRNKTCCSMVRCSEYRGKKEIKLGKWQCVPILKKKREREGKESQYAHPSSLETLAKCHKWTPGDRALDLELTQTWQTKPHSYCFPASKALSKHLTSFNSLQNYKLSTYKVGIIASAYRVIVRVRRNNRMKSWSTGPGMWEGIRECLGRWMFLCCSVQLFYRHLRLSSPVSWL